jgi:phosphoglycolate phosphatase-like HAD superfamily hydrolase
VFDFDGTLVDSNPLKQQAFAQCFSQFPERLEAILAYCRGHHHVPRGEKFRHVYEQILDLPYTPDAAAALHERFDAETTRQIIQAPEIRGATPFLQRMSRQRATALLSSTPHETLVHIVEQRGWRGYFTEIRGAPVDKTAWLRRLREGQGLAGHAIVFFGDTGEDAEAAAAAGCTFIAVGADVALDADGPSIPDFMSLLDDRERDADATEP